MSAVVETDWSPYSFTMNWQFTTPGSTVAFEAGEPFVAFFLIPRGLQETVRPVLRRPDEAPDLSAAHASWSEDRQRFLGDLKQEGSEAQRAGWQKSYMRGPSEPVDPPHRTRLKLRPFAPEDS